MANENHESEDDVFESSREYEIFTQSIYNELLKADGLTNCDVKHNVKIEGRSGCKHQIDVFWEFTLAGVSHKVAIECKDYSKTISIGRIRDFFGVITDIGNITGIFATKIGYQSGSKKFADHYGINLKVIRPPKKEDFKDRIQTVVVNMHLYSSKIIEFTPILDNEWIDQNLSAMKGQNIAFKLEGNSDEVGILDANGNLIKSIHEMNNELKCFELEKDENIQSFDFDNGYLKLESGVLVKVKSVDIKYEIFKHTDEIIIDALELARAIVKDVKTGEIKLIRKTT